MCEVTIVIPNYKGKEYLFSCVKSLYEKDQTENMFGSFLIESSRYFT